MSKTSSDTFLPSLTTLLPTSTLATSLTPCLHTMLAFGLASTWCRRATNVEICFVFFHLAAHRCWYPSSSSWWSCQVGRHWGRVWELGNNEKPTVECLQSFILCKCCVNVYLQWTSRRNVELLSSPTPLLHIRESYCWWMTSGYDEKQNLMRD